MFEHTFLIFTIFSFFLTIKMMVDIFLYGKIIYILSFASLPLLITSHQTPDGGEVGILNPFFS